MKNTDDLKRRVNACAEKEEFLKAARILKEEISNHGNDPELYSMLGNLLVSCGQKRDALAAHKTAVSLAPDSSSAWHLKGIAHFFFRDTDSAVESLKKAASLSPHDGEIHKNLAVGYFYQKRFEDAVVHLRLARSLGFTVEDGQMTEFEFWYFNSLPES